MLYPIAFGMPNMGEWLVIAAFGLLIFGKRLPEVGRNLGKGIVEFKKGLAGVEDEVNQAAQTAQTPPAPVITQPALPQQAPTPALPPTYRFDPYTGKPLTQESAQPAPEAQR